MPNDSIIERGVVDLAHTQAVGNHRLTVRTTIGDNVSGVEELRVTNHADCAAVVVGEKHLASENPLM